MEHQMFGVLGAGNDFLQNEQHHWIVFFLFLGRSTLETLVTTTHCKGFQRKLFHPPQWNMRVEYSNIPVGCSLLNPFDCFVHIPHCWFIYWASTSFEPTISAWWTPCVLILLHWFHPVLQFFGWSTLSFLITTHMLILSSLQLLITGGSPRVATMLLGLAGRPLGWSGSRNTSGCTRRSSTVLRAPSVGGGHWHPLQRRQGRLGPVASQRQGGIEVCHCWGWS